MRNDNYVRTMSAHLIQRSMRVLVALMQKR